MKTKELFLKDPLTWKLVNEGVSSNNSEDLATLRYELESFVCDGEYLNGMRRILKGYRDNFNSPEQHVCGSCSLLLSAPWMNAPSSLLPGSRAANQQPSKTGCATSFSSSTPSSFTTARLSGTYGTAGPMAFTP